MSSKHNRPTAASFFPKVIINATDFDVNSDAQQQLQAIAEAGGGKYFSVPSAAKSNQIFDRSKTLAELNHYRAMNLQNQNRVASVLTQSSNQLNACILQKQNRERASIMMRSTHPSRRFECAISGVCAGTIVTRRLWHGAKA